MSSNIHRRLIALEASLPKPDDAAELARRDAFANAVGDIADALRLALPSIPKPPHLCSSPEGWDHWSRRSRLSERIKAGATTAEDAQLLDELPADAVRLLSERFGLSGDPGAVVVWLEDVLMTQIESRDRG